MHKAKLAIVGIIALGLLNIPSVSAAPDTPATFVCETALATRAGTSVNLQGVDVSRSGRVLLSGFDGSGSNEETLIGVANINCGEIFALRSVTPGNPFQRYEVAVFDGAENIFAEHLNADGAGNDIRTVKRLHKDTGVVLGTSANLGASYDVVAVDDIRVNATITDYVSVRTTGEIIRWNTDFTRDFTASNSINRIRAGETTDILYGRTSSPAHHRINANTGASTHTTGTFTGAPAPPIRSELDNTKVYVARSTGSPAIMTFDRLTEAAFTTVDAAVTVTENQIGAGTATTIVDFDLDAQDNLLVCGAAAGTGGFIAKISTQSNSQRWNITLPTGTTISACRFDYQGGFWVAGVNPTQTTGYMFVRRYVGGDFATPAAPGAVGAVESTTPVGGGFNPINDAVTFTAEAWGMDESAVGFMFGLAIVGMIVFRVKNGHPILIIILAIIAIGLAVKLNLFPVWLLLVIVFAILAFAGTALFTKSEGGNE